MNVKIRNAVPDDAAAIQKIIAAGYRRSFAGLHSPEYLEQKIQEYLSPARIEKMANIIRNENSVNIVAENVNDDVVGSVGGMRDDNNNWELIALYVDENVIGDTKFALSLVQEFAKRIKETGIQCIYTGHCTGEKQMEILKAELGDVIHELYTGLEIEL